MHPFSSDLNCLFKITHFRAGDGLKIERKNPASWFLTSIVLSIGLLFLLSIPIFGKGDDVSDFVSFMLAAPGLGLLLYTNIKGWRIFHTDGSQLIGTISISDEIMSIELLDNEEGGVLRWYTALMGRPMRQKVVDQLNLQLSTIIGYDWKVDEINGEQYFAAVAYIEVGKEDEVMRCQITPNFRNQKDVVAIMELIAPHLDAVERGPLEYNETKTFDENDPSYA